MVLSLEEDVGMTHVPHRKYVLVYVRNLLSLYNLQLLSILQNTNIKSSSVHSCILERLSPALHTAFTLLFVHIPKTSPLRPPTWLTFILVFIQLLNEKSQ